MDSVQQFTMLVVEHAMMAMPQMLQSAAVGSLDLSLCCAPCPACQARALNAETKEANRTLQQFKLQEKARDKEQEAAIEAYARKKAELQVRRWGQLCWCRHRLRTALYRSVGLDSCGQHIRP
jgi:hypothetical protein